eukprot:UN00539
MATRPFDDWSQLLLGYDEKQQYLVFGYLNNLHKLLDSIELFTNIPNLIVHIILSGCQKQEYWNILTDEFELSQTRRSIAITDKLLYINNSAYGNVLINSTDNIHCQWILFVVVTKGPVTMRTAVCRNVVGISSNSKDKTFHTNRAQVSYGWCGDGTFRSNGGIGNRAKSGHGATFRYRRFCYNRFKSQQKSIEIL